MHNTTYRVARPDTAPARQSLLRVALESMRVRLLIARRTPGTVLIDLLVPLLIAAFPIAIGRSLPGEAAEAAFARNTGTVSYVAYLLIGSSVLSLTNNVLIQFAFWMRQEQQLGTLESLYTSAAPRQAILLGVALFGMLYSCTVFALSFMVGCLIFGVAPLRGNIALAVAFLALGMVALYGFCLIYGTLVMSFKEVNALIQLALWVVSLLAGVYAPISSLPAPLHTLALLLPPTLINNGVRAALLGSHWIFQTWYFDLAYLAALALAYPAVGLLIFRTVERQLVRGGGIGGA